MIEAARALASLALREGGANENERLAFVFRRTTSRMPTETELEVLRELLAEYAATGMPPAYLPSTEPTPSASTDNDPQ